jgi:hypothetical protein
MQRPAPAQPPRALHLPQRHRHTALRQQWMWGGGEEAHRAQFELKWLRLPSVHNGRPPCWAPCLAGSPPSPSANGPQTQEPNPVQPNTPMQVPHH